MVTREDVAKYAGVSKSTVSRVLNNSGYVSDENRKKVEKAIEKLEYKPNLIARSLKTRETKQILFHAPQLLNPFYTEVYYGMEGYAMKEGYSIVVSNICDESTILQRQFDGIIMSYVDNQIIELISKVKIPAVVTNYSSKPLDVPYVGIDIEKGAQIVIDYIKKNKHKDIGYITNLNSEIDIRSNVYKSNLGDRLEVVIDKESKNDFEAGYNAAYKLLSAYSDITALIAFNDSMAIGAMNAIKSLKLKIPKAISVMGFDNIIQSQYTIPPLTTIDIPKRQLGEEVVKMLIDLIQEKAVKGKILETTLVKRSSIKKL